MDKDGYRQFLKNVEIKPKAINSRVTRGNRIEREFAVSLDEIVRDDKKMLSLREQIYAKYDDRRKLASDLYNVVMRYYKFKNGKEMEWKNRLSTTC